MEFYKTYYTSDKGHIYVISDKDYAKLSKVNGTDDFTIKVIQVFTGKDVRLKVINAKVKHDDPVGGYTCIPLSQFNDTFKVALGSWRRSLVANDFVKTVFNNDAYEKLLKEAKEKEKIKHVFFVDKDSERIKEHVGNKYSKYYVRLGFCFYQYDAEIGELKLYDKLVPDDLVIVSSDECIDARKCYEKLLDESEDEDAKRVEHGVYFDEKGEDFNFYKDIGAKDSNYIWIWRSKDKLWFRYNKDTDELLNVYKKIVSFDIPDECDLKKTLMNKKLEEKIIGKIKDLIDKGACTTEYQFLDKISKYHNFKFYVWSDAKRSKHDNKFSKYFVEHNSYLYKYDAKIGDLTTYRPNLVPFSDWTEVSKEDCLDYKNCCERIAAGDFSPIRDIKEYCITANRFYNDEPVVTKVKIDPLTHDVCIDWVSVFDKEKFSKFSSYDNACSFVQNHPGLFDSSIIYNVKVIEVDNLQKIEEDENYEFEDGKKLKDSLKDLYFYKENKNDDFVWIFDKAINRWFRYDLLTLNFRIAVNDIVPTADKLQEISISDSDAENVRKEIKKLLNSEKFSAVAVTENFNKTASKSKEKKKMTATMKKVKVVTKSEKYTRNDIEQALNEAYDDYRYVLDFIKEDKNYVYIYLKEKEIN